MSFPDRRHWLVLSRLLDDLLELGPQAQLRRIGALRAVDPALAAELDLLLDAFERLKASRFLLDPADDDA
jgi:hypothetical protein